MSVDSQQAVPGKPYWNYISNIVSDNVSGAIDSVSKAVKSVSGSSTELSNNEVGNNTNDGDADSNKSDEEETGEVVYGSSLRFNETIKRMSLILDQDTPFDQNPSLSTGMSSKSVGSSSNVSLEGPGSRILPVRHFSSSGLSLSQEALADSDFYKVELTSAEQLAKFNKSRPGSNNLINPEKSLNSLSREDIERGRNAFSSGNFEGPQGRPVVFEMPRASSLPRRGNLNFNRAKSFSVSSGGKYGGSQTKVNGEPFGADNSDSNARAHNGTVRPNGISAGNGVSGSHPARGRTRTSSATSATGTKPNPNQRTQQHLNTNLRMNRSVSLNMGQAHLQISRHNNSNSTLPRSQQMLNNKSAGTPAGNLAQASYRTSGSPSSSASGSPAYRHGTYQSSNNPNIKRTSDSRRNVTHTQHIQNTRNMQNTTNNQYPRHRDFRNQPTRDRSVSDSSSRSVSPAVRGSSGAMNGNNNRSRTGSLNSVSLSASDNISRSSSRSSLNSLTSLTRSKPDLARAKSPTSRRSSGVTYNQGSPNMNTKSSRIATPGSETRSEATNTVVRGMQRSTSMRTDMRRPTEAPVDTDTPTPTSPAATSGTKASQESAKNRSNPVLPAIPDGQPIDIASVVVQPRGYVSGGAVFSRTDSLPAIMPKPRPSTNLRTSRQNSITSVGSNTSIMSTASAQSSFTPTIVRLSRVRSSSRTGRKLKRSLSVSSRSRDDSSHGTPGGIAEDATDSVNRSRQASDVGVSRSRSHSVAADRPKQHSKAAQGDRESNASPLPMKPTPVPRPSSVIGFLNQKGVKPLMRSQSVRDASEDKSDSRPPKDSSVKTILRSQSQYGPRVQEQTASDEVCASEMEMSRLIPLLGDNTTRSEGNSDRQAISPKLAPTGKDRSRTYSNPAKSQRLEPGGRDLSTKGPDQITETTNRPPVGRDRSQSLNTGHNVSSATLNSHTRGVNDTGNAAESETGKSTNKAAVAAQNEGTGTTPVSSLGASLPVIKDSMAVRVTPELQNRVAGADALGGDFGAKRGRSDTLRRHAITRSRSQSDVGRRRADWNPNLYTKAYTSPRFNPNFISKSNPASGSSLGGRSRALSSDASERSDTLSPMRSSNGRLTRTQSFNGPRGNNLNNLQPHNSQRARRSHTDPVGGYKAPVQTHLGMHQIASHDYSLNDTRAYLRSLAAVSNCEIFDNYGERRRSSSSSIESDHNRNYNSHGSNPSTTKVAGKISGVHWHKYQSNEPTSINGGDSNNILNQSQMQNSHSEKASFTSDNFSKGYQRPPARTRSASTTSLPTLRESDVRLGPASGHLDNFSITPMISTSTENLMTHADFMGQQNSVQWSNTTNTNSSNGNKLLDELLNDDRNSHSMSSLSSHSLQGLSSTSLSAQSSVKNFAAAGKIEDETHRRSLQRTRSHSMRLSRPHFRHLGSHGDLSSPRGSGANLSPKRSDSQSPLRARSHSSPLIMNCVSLSNITLTETVEGEAGCKSTAVLEFGSGKDFVRSDSESSDKGHNVTSVASSRKNLDTQGLDAHGSKLNAADSNRLEEQLNSANLDYCSDDNLYEPGSGLKNSSLASLDSLQSISAGRAVELEQVVEHDSEGETTVMQRHLSLPNEIMPGKEWLSNSHSQIRMHDTSRSVSQSDVGVEVTDTESTDTTRERARNERISFNEDVRVAATYNKSEYNRTKDRSLKNRAGTFSAKGLSGEKVKDLLRFRWGSIRGSSSRNAADSDESDSSTDKGDLHDDNDGTQSGDGIHGNEGCHPERGRSTDVAAAGSLEKGDMERSNSVPIDMTDIVKRRKRSFSAGARRSTKKKKNRQARIVQLEADDDAGKDEAMMMTMGEFLFQGTVNVAEREGGIVLTMEEFLMESSAGTQSVV